MPHDLLKPLLRPARASALRHLAPWLEEPEPEPEPAVEALYWRIYITLNNGHGTYTSIAEIEMRGTVGGPNLATGGTPSAASILGGAPASNAFDGNPATIWATAAGQRYPTWIRYQFPSPVAIRQIMLQSRSGAEVNQNPRDFTVEYSDDGASWTAIASFTNVTGWASSEIRTFLVQGGP